MAEQDNSPATYLAYNEAIGMLTTISKQCREDTQAMCNVAVYSLLSKIYYMKDTYQRVLQFMIDNDMYEKFISPILELQFSPPQQQEQQKEGEGNGESKPTDKKEEKDNNGNIKTKTDKNKDINEIFIRRLYDEDN